MHTPALALAIIQMTQRTFTFLVLTRLSIVRSLRRNNLAQDSRAPKRAPLGKSVTVGRLGVGGRRGMEGMAVHGREMETDEIVDGVEACREPSVLDATVVEATKSRDLNR